MIVLTVPHSVPDRAFTVPKKDLITATVRQLPSSADNETQSYTRRTAHTTRPAVASTHRHSRSISSTLLPSVSSQLSLSSAQQPVGGPRVISSTASHARKPSWASTSPSMQRQTSTGGSAVSVPRRSTSGRSTSTNSPTSYVALMRKQKATVWCDRSQSIEPRLAAQQKAAKQRAALAVMGPTSSGRTSTLSSGGVVGKIRHGGIPKAGQYVPQNMSGAGVPLRLLANEMLGEDEQEGRSLGDNSMMHARTGSGKSSINSAKYRSGYPRQGNSPQGGGTPDHEGIPEASETPGVDQKENYFDKSKPDPSDSEDSFGELREMKAPSSAARAFDQHQKADDLRRRGSVDDRTHSMGANVRLYVANPDADDDDD